MLPLLRLFFSLAGLEGLHYVIRGAKLVEYKGAGTSPQAYLKPTCRFCNLAVYQ